MKLFLVQNFKTILVLGVFQISLASPDKDKNAGLLRIRSWTTDNLFLQNKKKQTPELMNKYVVPKMFQVGKLLLRS